MRNTSRVRSHIIKAIEFLALLLAGMATSMYSKGESVSQNAMTGMLAYEASFTGCDSSKNKKQINFQKRKSKGRGEKANKDKHCGPRDKKNMNREESADASA